MTYHCEEIRRDNSPPIHRYHFYGVGAKSR
ncbi:Uncharacterised protein [Vibrio cholerae]|nr:Uncharacterised protein [Vibrio cholerae]